MESSAREFAACDATLRRTAAAAAYDDQARRATLSRTRFNPSKADQAWAAGYALGRDKVPAAARASELRSTERRLGAVILFSSLLSQLCAIGYFAKISSTRLNAFSAAAWGVNPPCMISAQAAPQTCSFWTWA